jgi:HSP20 family protein
MEDIMANLIRFSPRDDVFDDLLRGFFMRPVRLTDSPEMQIRMDVKEDNKAYTVHAEIPGVKKEDIHVAIDGNHVSISAEIKDEKDVKEGEKVLRSERYYGKVARSFTLGSDVDESSAQAHYDNGVLDLTLPKKAASKAKRLEIS